MHHINYFRVNLGTVYIGQCISVTDKAFCMTATIPPSFAYPLNWWPLFQPNKHIKIFDEKSRKKFFLTKKQMWDEVNIHESSINQKSNNTMPVMLCAGATFVKRNTCQNIWNSFISEADLGLLLQPRWSSLW